MEAIETLRNVLLILIGFGFVIFVHEMGHFLAARWAGVRVHAFAIGFGPAALSWRRGMGLRRGSTEPAYMKLVERERAGLNREDPRAVSPTEYRLNWFPFGGYVKMLGQEDLNPDATSGAPDSYTSKPVWKRMVIISAGVVMNLILAAVLFVMVFMAGLKSPAPSVGAVAPGSPAEAAGLEAGDIVQSIDGRAAETFADLMIGAAMAKAGRPLDIEVAREGVGVVTLRATPERDAQTGLLQLGVAPSAGATLGTSFPGLRGAGAIRGYLDQIGLDGVPPGARLTSVNGTPLASGGEEGFASARAIELAAAASGGEPVRLGFAPPGGGPAVETTITPEPMLQTAVVELGGEERSFRHLLGLVGAMAVESTRPPAARAGLRAGDVFARIGGTPWPSIPEGVREIQARTGGEVSITVLRDGAFVELLAPVDDEGRVGFTTATADAAIIGAAPAALYAGPEPPAAAEVFPAIDPGSRVLGVNGRPVAAMAEVREAIRAALRDADGPIELALGPPSAAVGERPEVVRTVELRPSAAERAAVADLGWAAAAVVGAFEPASVVLSAAGPLGALQMGVRETYRKVMLTYLTIQRLIEGSVQVRHLKGPVGITHIGAQMADRGFVYLLFFLALISANLAVINFLPMPIVDGGMFLMLCYEGVFRRPVPIAVQNALTLLGLVLIGAMFLTVTYYDLRGLLG